MMYVESNGKGQSIHHSFCRQLQFCHFYTVYNRSENDAVNMQTIVQRHCAAVTATAS